MILTEMRINIPQDGRLWEFTRISSDSGTNEINTVNRDIDEQLKAIMEENTRNILRTLLANVYGKNVNIVIETNEKIDQDKTNEQPNNTHEKNEVKNEQGLLVIRNMHNS